MLSIPELEAKIAAHWKEWRPNVVKDLRASGSWEIVRRKTAERAHKHQWMLMEQGYPDWAAEEVVLKEHVLLPPEEGLEDEELAEMEEEYQREQREIEAKLQQMDREWEEEEERAWEERMAATDYKQT